MAVIINHYMWKKLNEMLNILFEHSLKCTYINVQTKQIIFISIFVMCTERRQMNKRKLQLISYGSVFIMTYR